jgi:predicted membrane protein
MKTWKDEFWAWLLGISGAVVIGLIIAAFITGYAHGDPQRIFALLVVIGCFGVTPIAWALEMFGFFHCEDDEQE